MVQFPAKELNSPKTHIFFEMNRWALQQSAHQLVGIPCDGVRSENSNKKKRSIRRHVYTSPLEIKINQLRPHNDESQMKIEMQIGTWDSRFPPFMHHHGSCYVHNPCYPLRLFVQRHFQERFLISKFSRCKFPFHPFFSETSKLQGWKLAWDEFLNKSHQASHAPSKNPRKMFSFLPKPLHPFRLFSDCKQIVAVRGFK